MVFIVLTRRGFDEIRSRVIAGHDSVWVNADVLSEQEAIPLRESGWDLTSWSDPLDLKYLDSAIETVRLHHPNHVIWTETVAE